MPVVAPEWVYHADVQDLANDAMVAGLGGGFAAYVPGANTGSSNANQENLNRASRIGAGFAAERRGGGETTYRAGASIYVNDGSGDGADTAVPAKIITVWDDYLELKKNDYVLRMAGSNAAVNGLSIVQSNGGVAMAIAPRGDGGGTGFNGANAILKVGYTSNGRSGNLGGTLNASGADYAEYKRVKPELYANVPPGNALGIGADGLLTDVWSEISGRVFFKSTAPNVVGNDAWGTEEYIAARYGIEVAGDRPDMPDPVPFGEWAGVDEPYEVSTQDDKANDTADQATSSDDAVLLRQAYDEYVRGVRAAIDPAR